MGIHQLGVVRFAGLGRRPRRTSFFAVFEGEHRLETIAPAPSALDRGYRRALLGHKQRRIERPNSRSLVGPARRRAFLSSRPILGRDVANRWPASRQTVDHTAELIYDSF
jgi:hypothetical protein